MPTTTTEPIDVSRLDSETTHIIDTYRRVRGIYERTEAAMGRVPRYRVTMSTTTSVRLGDGTAKSS